MVKEILDNIGQPDTKFVVFEPTKSGNKVIYKIVLSNSVTGSLSEFQGKEPSTFRRIEMGGSLDNPIPPGGGALIND